MSAKRQKLNHRKSSLSEAFLSEDFAYHPSSSLRDIFGRKFQPEQRVIEEKAPRRVPRPQKRNLRDPFHILGDDEVHLIIAALPSRDTETLRRVSKLWKASSEYHCGRGALMRHFPWAVAKAKSVDTREAANLQFRRCLHFQQSLENGLATRAIRCDGASDWDIYENRLIWTRGGEDIAVRDLRSPDDKSIMESEFLSLDTSQALPEKAFRRYVRILPGGDFLIIARTPMATDKLKQTDRLIRIAGQGRILWSVDVGDPSVTRPAIGKDSVYFIHSPWDRTNADSCRKLSIVKYRLCDGSKVFDVKICPEQGHMDFPESDRSLMLTGDESLALWRRDSGDQLHTFSTSSGQHLGFLDHGRCLLEGGSLLPGLSPSFHAASFWINDAYTVDRVDYNGQEFFSICEYDHLDRNVLPDAKALVYDGNHAVLICTHHASLGWSTSTRDHDRTNPFGQFVISPKGTLNHSKKSPKSPAVVSLPGRSKREGKKRDLELELPWNVEKEDFFGIMNDYLIYQSPRNEFLVLVDFWPAW